MGTPLASLAHLLWSTDDKSSCVGWREALSRHQLVCQAQQSGCDLSMSPLFSLVTCEADDKDRKIGTRALGACQDRADHQEQSLGLPERVITSASVLMGKLRRGETQSSTQSPWESDEGVSLLAPSWWPTSSP